MSYGAQNRGNVLPEYTVDGLGTSFKVVLIKSVIQKEGKDGPEYLIPDYQGLTKKIAVVRSSHPAKLKGPDIKFLRKSLGLKSKDLADKLDISAEHLSRCENGDKTLSPNSEKVLRSLVLFEAIYVARHALKEAGCASVELMEKLNALLDKVEEVMSGLRIAPMHDVEKELTLYFRRMSASSAKPANDREPLEWLDEAA